MRLPIAVLAAACALVAAEQGCSFPETEVVSYARLADCIHSIPFNDAWRNGTIDTMAGALEQYAFSDIYRNTGPPWDFKVDILGGLEELRTAEFRSDSEFQDALSSLVGALHDLHTVYIRPGSREGTCYGGLYFLQPYKLAARVEGSRQAIFLSGKSLASEDLPTYNPLLDGLEVVAINGLEVISALTDWSDEHDAFLSKDQGARFNSALRDFVLRKVPLHGVPAAPSIVYTLRLKGGREVEREVPWLGLALAGADTAPSACEKPPRDRAAAAFSAARLKQQLYTQQPIAVAGPDAPPASGARAGAGTPPIHSWVSGDGATGALRISSFSYGSARAWTEALAAELVGMKEVGVRRLIVDVIGNGGGVVCLGYETMSMLVREYYLRAEKTGRYLTGLYDLKASASMARAFGKLGNLLDAVDPQTMEPFEDGAFYSEGPEHRRGGAVSPYSKQFFMDCPFQDPGKGADALPWFAPEDLLILTDGQCGSTCATFVGYLQEHGRARVAGVGGLKHQELQSQSFAGGFVTNVDAVNSLLAAAGEPLVPDFPTKVGWQFTWGELYSQEETDDPVQFVNLPTDFNVDYWAYDPADESTWEALYETVIASGAFDGDAA